jgi:nicotinamide-nucleotide amidase
MKLIAPVEAEVRGLLGSAIFAADQETMEDVVGRLLRARNKTVAVYEDLTCGNLSERLQAASTESFGAGIICNSENATRTLLTHGRNPARTDALIQDPVTLTDELAWSVRRQASCDFGLALHAVTDPADTVQNLARGHSYVALTDGDKFIRRLSTSAGRGQYDRIRMTLNALDLLRTALLEGMA